MGVKTHRRRNAAALLGLALVVLVGGQFLAPPAGASREYMVKIPGMSMYPTIKPNTIVMVTPMNRSMKITRGEILILKGPSGSPCGVAVTEVIDRVVGLPGETLSSKGNVILINGRPLKPTWSHAKTLGTPIRSVTLGTDRYYVMGDNWPDSCDSRVWGPVSRSDVLAKVVKIVGQSKTPATTTTVFSVNAKNAYTACGADGVTVAVAMEVFALKNPGVAVTAAMLTSPSRGGPFITRFPPANKYYRIAIVSGTLYVEAAAPSTKKVKWSGKASCAVIGLKP